MIYKFLGQQFIFVQTLEHRKKLMLCTLDVFIQIPFWIFLFFTLQLLLNIYTNIAIFAVEKGDTLIVVNSIRF